jgi:hypothetical protein
MLFLKILLIFQDSKGGGNMQNVNREATWQLLSKIISQSLILAVVRVRRPNRISSIFGSNPYLWGHLEYA